MTTTTLFEDVSFDVDLSGSDSNVTIDPELETFLRSEDSRGIDLELGLPEVGPGCGLVALKHYWAAIVNAGFLACRFGEGEKLWLKFWTVLITIGDLCLAGCMWMHTFLVRCYEWLFPDYPQFATGDLRPVPLGTAFYVRPWAWLIFNLRTLIWNHPGYLTRVIDTRRIIPANFRKPFLQHFVPSARCMPRYHSHREAAAERSGVNSSIVDAVRACGYIPYVVSPGAELIGDEHACRYIYSLKDANKAYRNDPITSKDALVITDCDYYMDINSLLRAGRPVVLYTFAPTTAGGKVTNGTFHFEGNTVNYLIDGGSSYSHALWDYSVAHVSVEGPDRTLIVFDVEIRQLGADGHRRVVVISPSAFIPYPFWTKSLDITPFERLTPTINGVVVLRTNVDGVDSISFAKEGIAESVTVPASLVYACQSRWAASKSPERSMITRVLSMHKFATKSEPELATCLIVEALADAAEFYRRFGRYIAPTSIIPIEAPVPRGARHYQSVMGSPTEDGREYGRQIHPPLVTEPAVYPVGSRANDEACVEERITRVRNDAQPPPKYDQYWAEFIKFVVPDDKVGSLIPISYNEVDARQARPAQRNRTERERPMAGLPEAGKDLKVQSFQKSEPYGKAGAPRNISTVPSSHQITLSSFTLPMKDLIFKHLPWYAPAKTPKQLAQRIADIASDRPAIIAKDLSRMDGTISKYLKSKYRAVCSRAVHPNYAAEFMSLLDAEDTAKGTTKHGVRYETLCSQKSGSPTTTDGNTFISGGTSYIGNRILGMSPSVAYEALGLYGGDDSVDPEDEEGNFAVAHGTAYSQHGLRLKYCDKSIRGEPVAFYGRYFIDPWTSLDSFADPWRTLAKLGSTVSTCDLLVAAANKASGYLATDSLTPIIGAWAQTVLRFGKPDQSLMSKEELAKENSAWPQVDAAAIRASFLKVSNIDPEEVTRVEGVIGRAQCLADIALDPPLDNSHLVKHDKDYVVQGEVFIMPDQFLNDRQEQNQERERATTAQTDPIPSATDGRSDKGKGPALQEHRGADPTRVDSGQRNRGNGLRGRGVAQNAHRSPGASQFRPSYVARQGGGQFRQGNDPFPQDQGPVHAPNHARGTGRGLVPPRRGGSFGATSRGGQRGGASNNGHGPNLARPHPQRTNLGPVTVQDGRRRSGDDFRGPIRGQRLRDGVPRVAGQPSPSDRGGTSGPPVGVRVHGGEPHKVKRQRGGRKRPVVAEGEASATGSASVALPATT